MAGKKSGSRETKKPKQAQNKKPTGQPPPPPIAVLGNNTARPARPKK